MSRPALAPVARHGSAASGAVAAPLFRYGSEPVPDGAAVRRGGPGEVARIGPRTAARTVSPDRLREAFRQVPAGAAVLTTGDRGRPVGLTVTSLRAVSLEPALVTWSITRSASTWAAFHRAAEVLVHVVAEPDRALAERFATSGVDRFAPPVRYRPEGGLPRIDGPELVLRCAVLERVEVGDATLFVAAVNEVRQEGRPAPLAYHDGGFRPLAEPLVEPAAERTAGPAAEPTAEPTGGEPRPALPQRFGAELRPGLVADWEGSLVVVDGRVADLTASELRLLQHLTRRPGRVLTRRQLLEAVWGEVGASASRQRSIDVHVHRLRVRLGRHAEAVATVRGVGYRWLP